MLCAKCTCCCLGAHRLKRILYQTSHFPLGCPLYLCHFLTASGLGRQQSFDILYRQDCLSCLQKEPNLNWIKEERERRDGERKRERERQRQGEELLDHLTRKVWLHEGTARWRAAHNVIIPIHSPCPCPCPSLSPPYPNSTVLSTDFIIKLQGHHVAAQMAPSSSKLIFFQLSMLAESATFTVISSKFSDLTYMDHMPSLKWSLGPDDAVFALAKPRLCLQPYSHRDGIRTVPQRQAKMLLPRKKSGYWADKTNRCLLFGTWYISTRRGGTLKAQTQATATAWSFFPLTKNTIG